MVVSCVGGAPPGTGAAAADAACLAAGAGLARRPKALWRGVPFWRAETREVRSTSLAAAAAASASTSASIACGAATAGGRGQVRGRSGEAIGRPWKAVEGRGRAWHLQRR